MKPTVLACAFIGLALSAQAQNYSSQELARRTIERRAVEAAIWGMPIVAMDAVRQGFLRDTGAKYNDIVYYSKCRRRSGPDCMGNCATCGMCHLPSLVLAARTRGRVASTSFCRPIIKATSRRATLRSVNRPMAASG